MAMKLGPEWQLQPGNLVGGWRVVKSLARGGMGEVYVGEHYQDSSLKGAIKVMVAHAAKTERHTKRFFEEARILRALIHPNVVRFYEAGFTQEGCPYLVTELLDGLTLGEVRQAEGRLQIDQTLDICAEVADGIHAVHEIGLLHRDVKPANIFITKPGTVKVLDFGIAKPFEVQAEEQRIASSTEEGLVVGTWAYMSPEQLLGERRLDRASDIFALGTLLYELLAGESPWADEHGMGQMEVTARRIVLLDPEPLPARLKDFPDDVWAVVRQAMRKRPAERFSTMAEFAERLRRARATFLASRGLPQGGAANLASLRDGGVKARPRTMTAPMNQRPGATFAADEPEASAGAPSKRPGRPRAGTIPMAPPPPPAAAPAPLPVPAAPEPPDTLVDGSRRFPDSVQQAAAPTWRERLMLVGVTLIGTVAVMSAGGLYLMWRRGEANAPATSATVEAAAASPSAAGTSEPSSTEIASAEAIVSSTASASTAFASAARIAPRATTATTKPTAAVAAAPTASPTPTQPCEKVCAGGLLFCSDAQKVCAPAPKASSGITLPFPGKPRP